LSRLLFNPLALRLVFIHRWRDLGRNARGGQGVGGAPGGAPPITP
jgi:hypothetical protein